MDDAGYLDALRAALVGVGWPDLDLWRDPDVDLAVTGVERVDGGPWAEVEVAFAVTVTGAATAYGVVRRPFDVDWRRLSRYDEPARYARDLATAVDHAARDLVRHHEGRPRPPDVPVEAAWAWLQDALSEYGVVVETAPGRLEVSNDRRTLTFVVTPEQWASLMGDIEADPMGLDETVGPRLRDETFFVYHDGGLARSVREELPPVRGTELERRIAAIRAADPDARFTFSAYPAYPAYPVEEDEDDE